MRKTTSILIIGAMAGIWLLKEGQFILFFALAGGFMLVSPILVTGYYQVIAKLRAGEQPVLTAPQISALRIASR